MSKFISNFKSMIGLENEDLYDEYEDNDTEEVETYEEAAPIVTSRKKEFPIANKVVNIHNPGNTKVNIIKPTTFDEAPQICDDLKSKKIVVVNTTGLEPRVAQRLLDFMAGACYALGGDLQEVESGVYVLSPTGVDVSRDLKGDTNTKGFLNWR